VSFLFLFFEFFFPVLFSLSCFSELRDREKYVVFETARRKMNTLTKTLSFLSSCIKLQ